MALTFSRGSAWHPTESNAKIETWRANPRFKFRVRIFLNRAGTDIGLTQSRHLAADSEPVGGMIVTSGAIFRLEGRALLEITTAVRQFAYAGMSAV
jgi:hypothetical protein